MRKESIFGLTIACFFDGISAGLQMTGIINPSLGWTVIGIATIVGGGLFAYGLKKKDSKDVQIDITSDALWQMYLNINNLIRQLREIAPLAFDAVKDTQTNNIDVFFEEPRVKDILTKIEIEMQNCTDKALCEEYQALIEYELWCAQFTINPIASPDIKLEGIHQRIRDRTIKLIKRGK